MEAVVLITLERTEYKLSHMSTLEPASCKLCQMVRKVTGAYYGSGETVLDLSLDIEDRWDLMEPERVPRIKLDSKSPILTAKRSPSFQSESNATRSLAVLPDAGSELHFTILSTWLANCWELHQHNYLWDTLLPPPTRLIDVRKDKGTVYLRNELKPGTKYVALSHRWGKSQPVITTKANLEARSNGITFSELPRTFQDAVTVTRNLRIDYLWIDSLCIVQDDPEDWKREAEKMENVFSFACCTISATSANGCDEGFLHRSTENSVRVSGLGEDPPVSAYLRELSPDFEGDVERSPLHQRAWVFQERALSQRNFHFTPSQTYFQCPSGVWCETVGETDIRRGVGDRASGTREFDWSNGSTLGFTPPLKSIFPVLFPDLRRTDSVEAFEHYLSYFSTLQITKASDRPFAILGLESRLAVSMNAISIYGVLISSVCRTLFWHRRGDLVMKKINFANEYVPSWSWMSYEGAIYYGIFPGTLLSEPINWGGDIRLNNAGIVSPVQETGFSMLVPMSMFASHCVVKPGTLQQEVKDGEEVVGWIRCDDPKEEDVTDSRSVTLGQVAGDLNRGSQKLPRSSYSCILLIKPLWKGGDLVEETYRRVGVGIVCSEYLHPDKQVDRVWVV
ncbi:hypothetical protein FSARC_11404 [Fusarium sarcochroum]|uniref:Heterokaryon incompatibility domain-containing protein n=1 Tax=Fusarium sarcochroum TaxID=1208366 RepID=A0A8H4TFM3_9HYPO|nr:hypothetical protein FSARC_11404 [Fusarium sarcochroum]